MFFSEVGLNLSDTFSKNVRKIKSHPWVSFRIKPLVLGSKKSLPKVFNQLECNKY